MKQIHQYKRRMTERTLVRLLARYGTRVEKIHFSLRSAKDFLESVVPNREYGIAEPEAWRDGQLASLRVHDGPRIPWDVDYNLSGRAIALSLKEIEHVCTTP